MKIKFLLAAVVLTLAATAVVVIVRPVAKKQQPARPAESEVADLERREKTGHVNFGERVRLAKLKGKKQLTVPATATLYVEMPGSTDELNAKLSNYTVVVARLVEKQSYMPDEHAIRSWNKFKILDYLSQSPPRPSYVRRPAPPPELLPLGADEILVHTEGGTVEIDGVSVTQNDQSVAQFQKSQKYLLVLSLDPARQIGEIELGPHSLLPLPADDGLDARWDGYYLQQIIKKKHGGSLGELKSDLKKRAAR